MYPYPSAIFRQMARVRWRCGLSLVNGLEGRARSMTKMMCVHATNQAGSACTNC